MNLSELEELFFNTSSVLMRARGEKILKKGLVSNIKGKKIDKIYHVYGDVLDNVNYEKYKTHIKIDIFSKEISSVSCNCNTFKELSMSKKLFMCEHLTATSYKFLGLLLHKKRSENTKIYKKTAEKSLVNLDVKITCKAWKSKINYELEFWIGIKQKYLIKNLKSFIKDFHNKNNIFFSNRFTYNHNYNMISSEDMGIIDYLTKYFDEFKNIKTLGKTLIIHSNELCEFLQCIIGKKIIFKYEAIEYKPIILKEDLPISFTLKEREKTFILTTHKKFPICVNEKVYFFNDNIYLPSKNQLEKYIPLYNELKEKGEVSYNKTIDNYSKIISFLGDISKDITVTEGVKRFVSNWLQLEIIIYKEDSNIYCNAFVIYYDKKINILTKQDNKEESFRNFYEEEKILMKLEKYNFIRSKDRLIFIGGDEKLFELLIRKKENINSLGTVILGKGLDHIKIYSSESIRLGIFKEREDFIFHYSIGDIENEELNSVFKSYKCGNKFYKTKDNGFIDFQEPGIKNLFNLVQMLNIDNSIEDNSFKIHKTKIVYLMESVKKNKFKIYSGIDILKDIEKSIEYKGNAKVIIPKSLNAKLREYQITGFSWFKNLSKFGFGGILADEMGLGKTIQTIAFILSEKGKNSLIITPTSLIYNWEKEIEKFAPTLKLGIIHGSKVNKEIILDNLKEYDVVLTTYGTLRNNIRAYNNVKFDYCIIDEAQNIKNPKAQNTMSVKEIKADIKFALTGTPIENNLIELWSIFDFIMPGYLYSNKTFEEKFIYKGNDNLKDLKLLIKPFILRRTKKQVAKDLPDKIEKKILVEMTEEQRFVYNSYLKGIWEKIKDKSQHKIEFFSYLTKLREICLDPSLVLQEYKGGSGKLKFAIDLINKGIISESKILVFSQFTSALNKIGEALDKNRIKFFYLDGSTPSKERIRRVNEFNSDKNIKVFLISLKAGGTGLNLTSASLVIHFDPWWNPAVEAQAADRAHRIGQKNKVQVIKLIARETIEEKIVDLQDQKKELVHSVITGELKNSNDLSKLSKEELIKLLKKD
ncbi:DEAD/DEAH box helicase [Clostridium rectalis]|uniref:DEAD/DEAH box helicase n=1 Tax=Clostridium rectalis TaxID=2040295 RepID=UPI000F6434CB|nr:DEAD/DEAH box helicase [Clostridium rectalis]